MLICGGTGSRLRPLTEVTNKSLLPVYDRPLICEPLNVLRKAGITEIAVITGPEHMDQIAAFLGSGSKFGCEFSFTMQETPGGIAQALALAEAFAQGDDVCAILGDNVFFDDLSSIIKNFRSGAHVFLKQVHDPERFGVATVDAEMKVTSIEEKPKAPKSNYAVTGCYVYDKHCFEMIKALTPSARGELEITDLTKAYLARGQVTASVLQEEWIDAGTFESLFKAAELIRANQQR